MTSAPDPTRGDEAPTRDRAPDTVEGTVESYETDEGVVFYDARNPLAWMEASATVRLSEHV
jgi:hypothetical protein